MYRDEASGLLGLPLEDTQRSESQAPDGSEWLGTCVFLRRSGDDIAPLDVSLGIGGGYLDAFASLSASPSVTSVADLGDGALLRLADVWGLDAPVGSIFVRYGDAVLSLTLGIVDLADGVPTLPGDAADQEAILRALAGIALGRLAGPTTTAGTCALLDAGAAAALGGSDLSTAEDVDMHDVWGPGCAYADATGAMRLFVAVSNRASAGPNFDSCTAGAEAIPGLGDAAFYTRSCQVVAKFKFMADPMVIARFGSTVVTVTMPPPVGSSAEQYQALRAWESAVARAVLEKLGSTPSATPTSGPIAIDPLAHPCALLTDAEASAGVLVAVSATREDPGSSGSPARCFFSTADYAHGPLDFSVAVGSDAAAAFGAYSASPADYLPVSGLGEAAFQEQVYDFEVSQTKLVHLFVRRGDAVISLYLHGNGWVGQVGGDRTAPGGPDAQLATLRHFAELILSRL